MEPPDWIGSDSTSVGNQEFDEGIEELWRMQYGGVHPEAADQEGGYDGDGFDGASFTYLAANVLLDDDGLPVFPAYAVRRFGNAQIGFIGMTLEGTPNVVTAAGVEGLTFLDEAETANALVPELQALGVETIVVLVHEGGAATGAYNECVGVSGPLFEIVTQPAYMVACAGAMIAFGVMSFVMAASPLAIVQCGLKATEAPVTIFVHVMGMFLPSFYTGNLIARFGIFNVMIAGIVLLVAGVVVALMGVSEWHFRGALSLNGVGWNFLFVGATTLLTTTYRPAERGKAQAFNDFMVFGVTTVASLMAGVVLELKGWAALNYVALALVLVALLVIGIFRLRNPSRA